MSDRRAFIKKSGLVCAAGILGLLSLDSCKTTLTITAGNPKKNVLTVPVNSFTTVKKDKTIEHSFIIVRHDCIPYSVALYKKPDGTYSALNMVCTHNHCDLNASKTELTCPCHGSNFSTDGKVLTGPASIDLITYKTEAKNETIHIYLT